MSRPNHCPTAAAQCGDGEHGALHVGVRNIAKDADQEEQVGGSRTDAWIGHSGVRLDDLNLLRKATLSRRCSSRLSIVRIELDKSRLHVARATMIRQRPEDVVALSSAQAQDWIGPGAARSSAARIWTWTARSR